MTRILLAFMAAGAIGAASCTPPAHATYYPACGMGVPSISTPWGGFCDSAPAPNGQFYHCQWGMGFQLCEWRWTDGTVAPAPVLR